MTIYSLSSRGAPAGRLCFIRMTLQICLPKGNIKRMLIAARDTVLLLGCSALSYACTVLSTCMPPGSVLIHADCISRPAPSENGPTSLGVSLSTINNLINSTADHNNSLISTWAGTPRPPRYRDIFPSIPYSGSNGTPEWEVSVGVAWCDNETDALLYYFKPTPSPYCTPAIVSV